MGAIARAVVRASAAARRRARPARRLAPLVVACALASTAADPARPAEPAAAAPPAGVPPAAAPAAPPAQPEISLDEIGARAEETAGHLRRMASSVREARALAALGPAIDAGTSRVAKRWSETADLLDSRPRRDEIDSLISGWQALRVDLASLTDRLDEHVRAREADAKAIASMQKSWSTTLQLAQRTHAPPAVISRIDATLAAIQATGSLVDGQRDRLLVLQDSLSRSLQGCDDAVARLLDARHQALRRMISRREPALWERRPGAGVGPGVATSLRTRLADRLAAGGGDLQLYVAAHRAGFVLTGLLALALVAGLLRARGRLDRLAERDPRLSAEAPIFRSPFAAGLLAAIVLSRPLRPNAPLELGELVIFLTIPALLVVLRPLLARTTARWVYALAGLLVLDLTREFLRLPPGSEQAVMLVEFGAASWVVHRAGRRLEAPDATGFAGSARLRAVVGSALRLLAVVAGGAALAAVVGYLDLADFLGRGALFLSYLALGLLAFRAIADALVALLLVAGPLARSRGVHGHRALIQRRIGWALDLAVAALGLSVAAQLFDASDAVRTLLARLLGTRLQLGGIDFTIGRVLAVPLVLIGAYGVARLVVFALEEDFYPRLALPRGIPYALSALTRYGLLLIGFLLALAALGLDLTRLTVLVSAFGLGLGFGLQQIVNNFVSGLILLFERPVQVGDAVQMGDLMGEVRRIGIRSSTIRTMVGAEVIVPNSNLIQDEVTNWTLSDRRRRLDLDVGVAYGTDAKRVLALLLEVARQDPQVRTDPEPEALFLGFGDSSLDFELRVWTEAPRWWRLRSDLCVALQSALRDAGIEVPFPQRDLHIRDTPPRRGPGSDPEPPR